jgi:beta-lactamase class A
MRVIAVLTQLIADLESLVARGIPYVSCISNAAKMISFVSKLRWMTVSTAIIALSACSTIPDVEDFPRPPQNRTPPISRPAPAPRPTPRPQPTQPTAPQPNIPESYQEAPPAGMEAAIRDVWSKFESPVGIAVARADGTWMISFRGDELFPQQSVSKTWVAMTFLDKVDRGELNLNEQVTLTDDDRVVFSQPITQYFGDNGYQTNYDALIRWSMSKSDNLANDRLMRRAGGAQAVRDMIAEKGLGDIRFGPGEPLLQSRIAGLEWKPEYRFGRAFQTARSALPMDVRSNAIWRYINDPIDGASPNAIARSLIRLYRGELLSPQSTRLMLQRMNESTTGPKRLKAGLPYDWRFYHKTGTGQDLFGLTAGYNDVSLATAPDGTTYAIVVMIRNTRATIPARMAMMQAVSRAVSTYHRR